VVVLSQAVTATINAADDGMPKATLKLPLRLNATPDVGFKTESTTPAAEQRVGEEIEYGITTTAVGRHPVPAASTVEPESQPQTASDVTEQVVETTRLGPVQVEQAVHGAVPDDDHVEPAEQEDGPEGVVLAEQTVSAVTVQADETTLFAPEQVEQAVQGAVPAVDQVDPATHDTAGTQAFADVLPTGDVWPEGQSEHIKAPAAEYFPAGHVPVQAGVFSPIV
jgi:hypothetical protein